jgi:hypothetical protein
MVFMGVAVILHVYWSALIIRNFTAGSKPGPLETHKPHIA